MFPFVNLTSIFHKRFRIGTENWNEFPYSFHRYNCWVWCSITSSESLTEFFAGPKLVGSQTSPSLRSSHIFFIHAKAAWFRFLTTKKNKIGNRKRKNVIDSSWILVIRCFFLFWAPFSFHFLGEWISISGQFVGSLFFLSLWILHSLAAWGLMEISFRCFLALHFLVLFKLSTGTVSWFSHSYLDKQNFHD